MSLPEPYYSEPGITIYCGDCRDILPHLPPVDLVLTDPPYGIGIAEWDTLPDDEMFGLLLTTGRNQIIWGMNYFRLPPTNAFLCWYKRPFLKQQSECEVAWTSLPIQSRVLDYLYAGNCQGPWRKVDYSKLSQHPTEKPISVMSWAILQDKSNPTIVLDPFMGSGTTLRAAKDLGLSAIGIEIEEKYCAIAVDRLRQEVLPFAGAK